MNDKPKGPTPPRPPAPPRPSAVSKPATPPLSAAKKPPPPPAKLAAKAPEIEVHDLKSEPPEAEAASATKIPLTVVPAAPPISAAPAASSPMPPPPAAPMQVPLGEPLAVPVTRPIAMPTSPEEDARKHTRLPFEVSVSVASEHNFFAGLSLNISEGGIFVATHQEYPVGTRLEISLALPGDEDPTTILTVVRWVRTHRAEDGGQPGLGLSFVDVPPEEFAKIQRFVKKRDPLYYDD
jgi:uncharacterized protein (TIGR02266 family)